MEIIPVIYILDGRCTALYKGRFEQKDTFHGTPLEHAKKFTKNGAKKLYLADLNGRRDKAFSQKEIVREIIGKVEIPVLLESGFINIESIQEGLDMGASQIVVQSPKLDFVSKIIKSFGPEKIMIQIFAKRVELIEDRVKKRADDYTEVVDYAEELVKLGVKNVMYKDRLSEGILTNPNYDEIDRLFLITGNDLTIYSSGGISEPHHIKLLKKIGASGAMIGKAFFERILTIKEAQEAANN